MRLRAPAHPDYPIVALLHKTFQQMIKISALDIMMSSQLAGENASG